MYNPGYHKIEASLWRHLRRHKLGFFSLIMLISLSLLCIFGPFFSAYGPMDQDIILGAVGYSKHHFLGTDALGRDVYLRLLYGGRMSLYVGLMATVVSVCVGMVYGMIAAYIGGSIDRVMMRAVDIVCALPYTFLVVIFMAFFGKGLWALLLAIGSVEWLMTARIVRAAVLGLKEQNFIHAAKVMGQSHFNIFKKHLLPNIASVVIVCVTVTVPNVILVESFLSFLGLGVPPPCTSWGGLIRDGVQALEEHPYLLFWPTAFFLLTLSFLTFIGDALRDALGLKRSA